MLRKLIFWLCLPFCLPQAIWVRKTAPRFAAADGEPTGQIGDGQSLRLVAIGDSIIAGVGARELKNALVGQTARVLADELQVEVHWKAIGKIGATSRSVLHKQVNQLPAQKPDFIIVSVGVNDLTSLSTSATWSDNLDRLLDALTEYAPDAVIGVAGIPPLRGFPLLPQPLRALFGLRGEILDDAGMQVIAGHPNAVHVPLTFDPQPENFSADGFHPNENSYPEFGRLMAEALISKNSA